MASADLLRELQAKMDAIASGCEPVQAQSDRRAHDDRVASGCKSCDAYDERSSRKQGRKDARDQESGDAAFRRVVAMLNAGDKSERQLRDRLDEKGFSPEAIDEAIASAKSCGFIDDRRYAEVLVRSRISQGRGIKGIERELEQNNISLDILDEDSAQMLFDESSELDRALDFLARKPPRAKNARDAAYRKLVQKGYSSAVSARAARIWHEGRGNCP